MKIETSKLCKDESVYLELQELFERAGYRKFKMRKFEEYSLYLENKSFLASENVIAFNDPSGRLLALKPDVTLSIAKNAKATETGFEKVYYRESVYRLDARSREYREINQVGLEFIGNMDAVQTAEICTLAVKSLEAISGDYIFAVSHMGFVTGLLQGLSLKSESAAEKILGCLKSKNAHDLDAIAEEYGIEKEKINAVKEIACAPTEFAGALETARKAAITNEAVAAVNELESLYSMFRNSAAADKIRLDFSVLNDVDYYNGIIFQGYVEGCSKVLLSGGRYDKLLGEKRGETGAMGFALALSDLNAFAQENDKNKVDVLLRYKSNDAQQVLKLAEKIRLTGKSVIIAKQIPSGVKYGEILDAENYD